MNQPIDILEKYWGHQAFRPLQEDIIQSVLHSKDTLALLPTGGGKSICFQVPGLMLEGVCIVISPLIALMKDQVSHLRKQNILAYSITSENSLREIDRLLDNCIYGDIKFLYVSPERLKTEIFQTRFKKMKVGLIAVDEAHCISQWGYDFRPAYTEISAIRDIHPEVPVIALTASATPEVVEDIQQKLAFKKKCVFQKSFERENLTYAVIHSEDKIGKLAALLSRVPGTAIIYAGTRKKTRDISMMVENLGVSCAYYHAGLSIAMKTMIQEDWIKGKIRVIVATNAFGMGIDKPDVRLVAHWDIPSNPESYYQEAGRAGRDGEAAYAVSLFQESDRIQLEKSLESKYPPLDVVRKIYRQIGSYLRIAIGAGEGEQFEFDLPQFLQMNNLQAIVLFNALTLIERAGYVTTNLHGNSNSICWFSSERKDFDVYVDTHKKEGALLQTMLRIYGGIAQDFVRIDEAKIGEQLQLSAQAVREVLMALREKELIQYRPATRKAIIQLLTPRMDETTLRFPPEIYNERKKIDRSKLDAMLDYVNKNQCRSQQLLQYFGELKAPVCGHCDVCKQTKPATVSYELLSAAIGGALISGNNTLDEILAALPGMNKSSILEVINWNVERGEWFWTGPILGMN